MVGWGFAFGRGMVILLWSIIWAIVASVIAVVVTGGSFLAIANNPTAAVANPLGLLATLFLGVFLSVFIAIIGLYASIVKVTVDGTISQLEKKGMFQGTYSIGPPIASAIGTQPTLTIGPAQRMCQSCGKPLPVGSLKCPNCGASI